jgi:quinol monooxygenase YgiN
MSKKRWWLPLSAIAPLVFGAPTPVQADQQQYVVTYVEFLPAFKEVGGELLEQLAFLGRHAKGAVSFSANQEIQRRNFYVLIEVWKTAEYRQTFEGLDKVKALLAKVQPLLEAPFDERPGTLIE